MKTILFSPLFLLLLPIFALSQNPELITQEKNLGVISKIIYSPNGQYIASANERNFEVKIWDVASEKLIGTLVRHKKSIEEIVFSENGSQLLTSDEENKTYIWDLKEWKVRDSIESKSNLTNFSNSNGSWYCSNDQNEILKQLNYLQVIAKSKQEVIALGFIQDKLITVNQLGYSQVDESNGKIQKPLSPDKKIRINNADFSNNHMILQAKNGHAYLFNSNLELSSNFETILSPSAISFNSKSNLYALANHTGKIIVYNVKSGEIQNELKQSKSHETIHSLTFSPDGSSIAASGYKKLLLDRVYSHNNVINVWDINRGSISNVLKGDVKPINAFAFNPELNLLYTLQGEKLDIWSMNSGERLGSTMLHDRMIESKDRLVDNFKSEKDKTEKVVNDKADEIAKKDPSFDLNKFNKLKSIASGDLGSLKNEAKDRIESRIDANKESLLLESKALGKAAFARFGFQKDKIIISSTGKYLLTELKNDEIRLYSLENGLPVYIDYVKTGQKEFHDIIFNKEETQIIVGGSGKNPVSIVNIEDIQTKNAEKLDVGESEDLKLNGLVQIATALTLSNDGNFLVALFNTGRVVCWHTGMWTKIADFNPKATITRKQFVGFSEDGTKLFVNTGLGIYTYDFSIFKGVSGNEEVSLADALTFKKVKMKGFPVMTHKPLDQVITIDNNQINFLDVASEETHHTEAIRCNLITDIQVNKYGYAGVSLRNGELRIYDPKTGENRLTMVTEEDNAIFKTPDNYYKITKEGQELVTFRYEGQSYPFEQFDAIYNRPDIVLEKMNSEDESLKTLYKKAYEKRLNKLGLHEEDLGSFSSLPKVSIVNISEIPFSTNENKVQIRVQGVDNSTLLKTLIIYNNNVPIFGKNGKEVNSNSFEQKVDVNLTQGSNKIQVSVLNAKGIESLQQTIIVNCNKKSKPNLYVVSIGTSKYKDSKYNLSYAAKDANDIVKTFTGNTENIYGEIFTKTVTNESSVKSNITSLKKFLNNAKIDDIVIVFVAGHGLLDSDYNYYYGTYDVNFSKPQEKGLSYDMLENLLDGISPLKKLMIMDTCHSGEVEEEDVLISNDVIEENEDVMFRSVGPALSTAEMSPSKMMKELFTDLRRGTGTTVISSAGGTEYAMESDDWKNGLFTYSLLFGLRNKTADLDQDGRIMLSELQLYVTNKVFQLSKGKQNPTTRIQNIELDYVIW